jgi:uncharacterized Fe-S cluster-containing MiaB family protein
LLPSYLDSHILHFQDFILKTWTSIKALEPAQTTTNHDDVDIQQKISNVCNSIKVPLPTNVLKLWESKRYEEPELFKIAQVVLSVPSTQISVNRAIGAHELLTTYSNQKVAPETIGNIMITKLNSEVLESFKFS